MLGVASALDAEGEGCSGIESNISKNKDTHTHIHTLRFNSVHMSSSRSTRDRHTVCKCKMQKGSTYS